MYYEEVFRELNKKRVKYLVVGGVALVLHGVVRLTVDLDLMLKMSEKNLTKFVSAMNSLGYKPKVPVKPTDFINPDNRKKWMEEKNMKVFSFFNPRKPFMIVDIFVEEPINFSDVFKDRIIINTKKIKIPIISIRYLKILKKISGREQDLTDIKLLGELERIKHEK